MQKKGEISEYREKLDKTLSSPELTDHESLKSLLRNQLSGSSPECNANILDKRTADVSKLLSMLRSVSMTDASSSSHGDWKIKQDLEDCRVMYRQGLEGSPFHTLLVEGYMDSPLEDCLCVSWETALYKNWWPQFAFPPFKILQGTCLHKVRTCEQVCLVRMKVPWPLSEREVIVHYFLFEYFKDGLVVVLLNSISDLDSIGVSAKDMAKKVIPEATSAVRIDLVGGFALQKVTSQRSFVRVIGELDIKLDLVPPSLMNFIARQIVGNGFKLYKKAAGSVAKLDEDFSRALADPLYINIRQAMYSTNKATEEEQELETENKHENDEDETVHCRRGILEIEEEKEEEEEEYFEESVSSEERNVNGNIRRQFSISTEVEQALGTLDRAINMVRNITPVKEDEELPPNKAEDQRKQVSVLEIFENVPQRSQRQYFSTSRVSVTQEGSYFSQEDNKREKETGDDHLNKERERHQMNKTKKLVASISTLLTRRTSHPSSSTLRCNPLAAISTNPQTDLNPVKPLAVSIRRLQFSGRAFSSESSGKRISSVCWNCGFSSDKAAFLFCDSCRSIQPVVDSVDYFQIFGLEKKYELEGGSLEGKYKDWQKKLHPDLVHNKSQKERDYAADQSAKVTEACRTLTKRLSRAMYIMKLNGKNVNEEETVTDPTLLMEMMELREAIAEADDSKELNQIQSQVQENLKQWSDSFADNFESQRFDEAVNCIRRMTYYEKACEEIVKKL